MKKIFICLIIISSFSLGYSNSAVEAAFTTAGCAGSPSNCPVTENISEDQEIKNEENKIYQERLEVLTPFKDFFGDFDVELNTSTSESEYRRWLKELTKAKENYEDKIRKDKEQVEDLKRQEENEKVRRENEVNKRILELENKVNELELGKTTNIAVPEKIYIKSDAEKVLSPTKVVKENIETKLVEKEQSQTIEKETDSLNEISSVIKTTQSEPKKITWFKRIINWFTGK